MKIVKLKATQFDRFASTNRYRNFYQTSMYANVISKFGYNVHLLGIVNDNNKLIGASVIVYREVLMHNKIAYAPRGILFNYENTELVQEGLNCLKKSLAKQGFMFLRIDPYIPLSIRDTNGNIININNKGTLIIDNIKNAGFDYKGKTLFFETEKPRWEALVLLQRDNRDIFAKMDKRTRTKIRRAINGGVEIIKSPNNDVKELYKLVKTKDGLPLAFYKKMCEQFEPNIDIYYAKINTEVFLVNSRKNYEKEIEYNNVLAEKIQNMDIIDKERENYLNKKMESDKLITSYKNSLLVSTELLKTNPDGIIIGASMVIKYDNAAFIFAEGIDEKYGYLNANYLLKWQIINDYNSQGFKYVNFNGIVGEFKEKNKYSGLNEAKLGFNSTVTEYIGEFDIILNTFNYNLYKKMNKE